ncbi:MAG: hypothetical protein R2788_13175 [Saprospiraceae bacterium]
MAAAAGVHVKKFWKNVSQHPYSGFSLNNSSEGSIFNQLAVFSSTVRQFSVGSWQSAVGSWQLAVGSWRWVGRIL